MYNFVMVFNLSTPSFAISYLEQPPMFTFLAQAFPLDLQTRE